MLNTQDIVIVQLILCSHTSTLGQQICSSHYSCQTSPHCYANCMCISETQLSPTYWQTGLSLTLTLTVTFSTGSCSFFNPHVTLPTIPYHHTGRSKFDEIIQGSLCPWLWYENCYDNCYDKLLKWLPTKEPTCRLPVVCLLGIDVQDIALQGTQGLHNYTGRLCLITLLLCLCTQWLWVYLFIATSLPLFLPLSQVIKLHCKAYDIQVTSSGDAQVLWTSTTSGSEWMIQILDMCVLKGQFTIRRSR